MSKSAIQCREKIGLESHFKRVIVQIPWEFIITLIELGSGGGQWVHPPSGRGVPTNKHYIIAINDFMYLRHSLFC